MKSEREIYEHNAQIYKMLSNPKRLELLNLLNKEKELTVTELTKRLEMRKANVSQHLSVLRSYKLVKARREAQSIYYSLSDPRIVEPCKIFRDIWHS